MYTFSWKACICGLLQVCFLYKIELFSWFLVFLPTTIYLILELFQNLLIVFTEDYLYNEKIIDYLLYLATLGLVLSSILLFAESKEAGLEFYPALVPIFMLFLLHCTCRVLHDPPLFLTPLINLLAPPMAVCTMSGSCSSFYLSVTSSLFGAFGSSFVDFFELLKPLTYVLLFITLLSVYSTHKTVRHRPFLLALTSCSIILLGEYSFSLVMITIGNCLLVASVIWNNRLLKVNEPKSV